MQETGTDGERPAAPKRRKAGGRAAAAVIALAAALAVAGAVVCVHWRESQRRQTEKDERMEQESRMRAQRYAEMMKTIERQQIHLEKEPVSRRIRP